LPIENNQKSIFFLKFYKIANSNYASGKNLKDQLAHNSMLTFEDQLKYYPVVAVVLF